MEKSEARAFVLERRDGIETRVRAEKCTTICGVLTEMLDDIRLARENVSSAAGVCYRQEPLAVALYQAMKSEVSLDCFIEEVYERGLTACFPCMVKHPAETGRNTSMTFRAVSREQYEHGGVAFLEALPALDQIDATDEEKIGVEIVRKALTAPVKKIAENAGYEGSVVVEKIKGLAAGEGLNSANGEWGNMIEMGVLDPVKVSRVTLQNAASVAGLILITEATVSDEHKDKTIEEAITAAASQAGGPGMY